MKVPPRQIVLASANTHFGDAVRADNGLASILQHTPDILLLQEVTNTKDELQRQLHSAGFKLVHFASEFGLATAIRTSAAFSAQSGSIRTHELQRMGFVERSLAQQWARGPHAMTKHGMQATQFNDQNGHALTVVNTRLTVPLKKFARARQVAEIGRELSHPYYTGPLVVAGDMNHHPGPGKVDRRMHSKAQLNLVDLGSEPTRHVRGSKQEKYLKHIARLQGRPLEDFDAQLDAMLYRGKGLEPVEVWVVDIESDHRAVIARFTLPT